MSSAAEPAAPSPATAWRRRAVALAFCALLMFFGLNPGAAFIALLVAPLLAVWLALRLLSALRGKARWRDIAIDAAAVAATVALLFAAQAVFERLARRAADEARRAVLAYRSTHRAWPLALVDAGVDDAARLKRWRVRYLGEGAFVYSSTFDPFDRWYRGADDVDWSFRPD